MNTLRKGLPPLPKHMAALPLDERGYPVPWFVEWIDGKPDFRVMDPRKMSRCVKEKRCWVCGGRLGTHLAFVIGPMCAVNRVSAEPPAHRDCAEFSATACPFLKLPNAKRRESNYPEGIQDAGGVMCKRNPGVTLVWITDRYKIIPDGGGGKVFSIGAPRECQWYAEGRHATHEEVLSSITSGLPFLAEMAAAEGQHAVLALGRALTAAMPLLPAAA